MSQAIRDENAANAIKAAILKLFGSAIAEIEVRSGDDHNDQPALFVTVFMKAAQRRMPSSQWLDTIAASASALRGIDDDRFPYVTFLAPEDESAEDTRPAA